MREEKRYRNIRRVLLFFMAALSLSGLTAVPVVPQLRVLLSVLSADTVLYSWLHQVLAGYQHTAQAYPFLLYGYGWLAFAHLVLAILFIGPYKDPVKNIWVIQFGMIACGLVIPVAFVAGALGGILVWWRVIDCSFGVFGFLLLYHCYRHIQNLTVVKESA